MTAEERRAVRAAINLRRREQERIPILTVRCPVHRRLVGRDGEGRLLGRCDGCVEEAARAIQTFSSYSTGPGGDFLADVSAGARKEQS